MIKYDVIHSLSHSLLSDGIKECIDEGIISIDDIIECIRSQYCTKRHITKYDANPLRLDSLILNVWDYMTDEDLEKCLECLSQSHDIAVQIINRIDPTYSKISIDILSIYCYKNPAMFEAILLRTPPDDIHTLSTTTHLCSIEHMQIFINYLRDNFDVLVNIPTENMTRFLITTRHASSFEMIQVVMEIICVNGRDIMRNYLASAIRQDVFYEKYQEITDEIIIFDDHISMLYLIRFGLRNDMPIKSVSPAIKDLIEQIQSSPDNSSIMYDHQLTYCRTDYDEREKIINDLVERLHNGTFFDV